MSIFKTKKSYVIETTCKLIPDVRKFIKENAIAGIEPDVRYRGSLLADDFYERPVRITFVSYVKKEDMRSKLIKAFAADYNLSIRRKLTFVYEKEEVES